MSSHTRKVRRAQKSSLPSLKPKKQTQKYVKTAIQLPKNGKDTLRVWRFAFGVLDPLISRGNDPLKIQTNLE